MKSRPLEGIKVVELTTFVAAPVAGRFLAEWGAEVVKIETMSGDPLRGVVGASWGVPEKWRTAGHDIGFDLANWDKNFVSINLADPEGMEFLMKMIGESDVFITNYRPQALESMKLDYETLQKIYPGLVYAHLVSYGEKGPDADRPGFDNTTYAARGGLCDSLRQKDGVPPNIPGALGDQTTGAYLSSGVCAALACKARTGRGDKVVVSLLGSAVFSVSYGIEQTQFPGVQSYPRDREVDNNPFLNTYRAIDGRWVQLNIPVYSRNYGKVMTALGRTDLVDHPVYSSLVKVIQEGKKAEVTKILSDQFALKTADEWQKIFVTEGLTLEKHYSTYEVASDEQVWANDYIVKRTYPDGEEMALVQCPIQFYSLGRPDFNPAKEIGADTEVYLRKYGYSEEKIAEMKAKKVVR